MSRWLLGILPCNRNEISVSKWHVVFTIANWRQPRNLKIVGICSYHHIQARLTVFVLPEVFQRGVP
jgi:hypothetical protein